MKFFGFKENKKIVLDKPENYEKYILTLKDKQRIRFEVSKQYNKRTINQNSLYWFWLGIIGDELGYDPDEVHDSFKAMFLTDKSKKIPLVRSTTMLDTLQFVQYLEKIVRFCATELSITLPLPEDL